MFQPLSIANVDKTYIFKTDLSTSFNLVRTGTMTDGNCFIHAVFHALDKDNYRLNPIDERVSSVKSFRDTMVDQITMDTFTTINNGEVARVLTQSCINENLENVIKYLRNEKVSISNDLAKLFENKPKYEDVLSLLDIEVLSSKVLPRVFKKTQDILKYDNYIIGYTTQYLKLSECDKRDKISKLLYLIVKYSIDESFQTFISKLKRGSHVDDFTIDYISNELKVNVYIIESENRLPYKRTYSEHYKDNVVLLWINENHYEILGELVDVENSTIERVFENDHVFISNIKEYLETDTIPESSI